MRTWEDNAHEFGALTKQGKDVRLALLVACSVETGTGGPRNWRDRASSVKVSAREFAEVADTTKDRVMRHLTAWDALVAAGWDVNRDGLTPDSAETLDLSDDFIAEFNQVFDASKSGGRPRASVTEIAKRVAEDDDYAAELVKRLPTETQARLVDVAVRAGGRAPAQAAAKALTDGAFGHLTTEEAADLAGVGFDRTISSVGGDPNAEPLQVEPKWRKALNRMDRDAREVRREVDALPRADSRAAANKVVAKVLGHIVSTLSPVPDDLSEMEVS